MTRFGYYLDMAWLVAGAGLWISAIYYIFVGEYTHAIALMILVIAADMPPHIKDRR